MSINTQCRAIIFIGYRFLPSTTLQPRGETLFHLPLINLLELFKDFSSIFWKYSKIFQDFFACRIVLPANHQYPGNIQRLSEQSTAATSNSNQQQQSAAATSISNQHSSYQHHLHNQRRPPLFITTVPSKRYPASSWPRISCPVAECNHRTAANFCDFSTFLKIPFL